MERSLIICVVLFIGFSYAAVLPNQKGKDRTSLLVHQVILEKKTTQIYCVMTCFKTPLVLILIHSGYLRCGHFLTSDDSDLDTKVNTKLKYTPRLHTCTSRCHNRHKI